MDLFRLTTRLNCDGKALLRALSEYPERHAGLMGRLRGLDRRLPPECQRHSHVFHAQVETCSDDIPVALHVTCGDFGSVAIFHDKTPKGLGGGFATFITSVTAHGLLQVTASLSDFDGPLENLVRQQNSIAAGPDAQVRRFIAELRRDVEQGLPLAAKLPLPPCPRAVAEADAAAKASRRLLPAGTGALNPAFGPAY